VRTPGNRTPARSHDGLFVDGGVNASEVAIYRA
jgi:hypothetical protein